MGIRFFVAAEALADAAQARPALRVDLTVDVAAIVRGIGQVVERPRRVVMRRNDDVDEDSKREVHPGRPRD